VHEARRAARRPAREVVALDEGDGEPAQRRLARDAGARDPPADDEDVEAPRGERLKRGGPAGERGRLG
jgi:hypothetical protein